MTVSADPSPAPALPVQDAGEALARRIMIVTDAWHPQVNGVVTTLAKVIKELREMGCELEIVSPNDGYRTIPLITYSEIRLAINARDDIEERFLIFAPDAVHIATEGPLGWAARGICLKYKFPFTTSYHTQFPEYVHARFPWIPLWAGYRYMHAFHDKSGRIMVATPTMMNRLVEHNFKNVTAWSRGVETDLFHPAKRDIENGVYKGLKRPVWLNVGRVAVEKNIDAFLKTDLPGTKVVVGDGPQRAELMQRYPDAVFPGVKTGEDLARHFADADVFVFPSLTDTFGLVLLEAMAAGTPVAAFPAPGPIDILPGTNAGICHDDLRTACMEALKLDRATARRVAEGYSWRACAEAFQRNLAPLPKPEKKRFWRRLAELRRRRRERRDARRAAKAAAVADS
ncbi:MAG: glycosyltransferase family 1 protein [Hydrogenophilaceae bacterium]|jgi:glycosyltransferase involved in cell wall biosynthesis|nr:glycosyltransferase family 1 protein [Hydrogenophilaceae bacterium]